MNSTSFNHSWLKEPDFQDWLKPVNTNPRAAQCKVCFKHIELSNMGKRALISHSKSQKHKAQIAKNKSLSKTQPLLFQEDRSKATSNDPNQAENVGACAAPVQLKIDSSILSRQAKEAEILWALFCVMHHFSARSNDEVGPLFRRMFQDHPASTGYSSSRTKLGYLITFGIAPAFLEMLMDQLRRAKCYSILFDETFNSMFQLEQLDVYVRYWCTDNVKTRYVGSEFINETNADALKTSINKAISDLDEKKVVHVGMDGPNVNIKVANLLKEEREIEDRPALLELGTCSLHVVHGALQTGNLNCILSINGHLES